LHLTKNVPKQQNGITVIILAQIAVQKDVLMQLSQLNKKIIIKNAIMVNQ
jgi:hypothetical protein